MKHKVNFNKEKHSTSILDRLETMRKEKKYCDFKIKVGTEVIETHRNILAAGSDYFDAMLSHDTKESRSGIVEMMDVDADCVKICLDYIYKSEVDIPDEKYEQLLYVGHLMQLQELCDGVADLIGTSLDLKCFFKTKRIAEMFECKKLEEKCEKFAENNFLSISIEAEFGDSDKSFIGKMLKSKKVNLSEEKKLDALIRWVKSDKERKKVFLEMMQCLELGDVAVGYRRHLLENEPLLNDCMDCFRLLSFSVMDSSGVKSRPLENVTDLKSCSLDENLTDRLDIRTTIVVFDEKYGHLRGFNPRNGSLTLMQRTNFARKNAEFSAVALERDIYVLCKKTVFRLDSSDKSATWERMADMLEEHGIRPSATDLGSCIYVVGGDCSSSVEKYNPVMNQWLKLKDRRQIISYSAVTKHGGDIYCVGGLLVGDLLHEHTNMVERFNVASSEWIQLAPMNEQRAGISCVTMDDEIYALGGFSFSGDGMSYSSLSTVECYNIASNLWTILKPMKTKRRLLRSFAVDGVIYAFGGYREYDSSNTVEKYDVKMNKWDVIQIPRKMRLQIAESVKVVILD